jgi:hypothetical protein
MVDTHFDLDSKLPRISGAPSIGLDQPLRPIINLTAPAPVSALKQSAEDEPGSRFSIGRIFEATVQVLLIIPLAVLVCAIVAFAILPLHSGFRWDNLSDGQE